MKKISALSLALLFTLLLTACSASGDESQKPPENSFTIGNLVVTYPKGSNLLNGTKTDTDETRSIELAKGIAIITVTAEAHPMEGAMDYYTKPGYLLDIMTKAAGAYENLEFIEEPNEIEVLDTRTAHSTFHLTASGPAKTAQMVMFSDEDYLYGITSIIQDDYVDEYTPWVDGTIERLAWK